MEKQRPIQTKQIGRGVIALLVLIGLAAWLYPFPTENPRGSADGMETSATGRNATVRTTRADTEIPTTSSPNPFVAGVTESDVSEPAKPTETVKQGPTDVPEYAEESVRFTSRIPALSATLDDGRFAVVVHEVDMANPTTMVVLAETDALADNLDGFFRFTVDEDGRTWGGAPVSLGISHLYSESDRAQAHASGTFCSDGLDVLLDQALRIMLGDRYDPGVSQFILQQYRVGMAWTALEKPRPKTQVSASFDGLEVVFNDGHVTYVDFYP